MPSDPMPPSAPMVRMDMPDISPAYAAWQAPRIASASGLSLDQVQDLIRAHTQHPWLGFIGTDRVNVTELNVALEALVR